MFPRLATPLLALVAVAAAGPTGAQQTRSGHVAAELVSEFEALTPGQAASVGLRLVHEPHWHTYWTVPGDAGLPTRLAWQLPPGVQAGPIQWPVPELLRVGSLANYGYEGTVLLPVTIKTPAALAPGSTVRLAAHADWLVCADICIPESADLTLVLPVEAAGHPAPGRYQGEFAVAAARIPKPIALSGASAIFDGTRIRLQFVPDRAPERLQFFPLEPMRVQAAAAQPLNVAAAGATLDLLAAQPVASDFKLLRGVLVADGGPGQAGGARSGWAGVIELPLKAGVLPAAPPSAGSSAPAQPGASMSWITALVGAFVGGLILNLMPCVFPVALRAGGSELGWGFQMQSPLMIALLTALFFGIGLNLLGAFEVSVGTGLVNSKLVQRFDGHHLRGSFATGVLAVLVASPCTAPFMGAALTYAVWQPAPVALSVFAMLGAGMATPYLALTLSPSLLQRLPRPGSWMQHLRQLMAFPMFVTCVWLLWVLAQQIDVDALAWVLAALVALGLAGWSAGQAQRGARVFGWVGTVAAVASALVMIAATEQATLPSARAGTLRADSHGWADWSPPAQVQALSLGRPVFVDFTAAWCLTCQANKRLVLHSSRVAAAFASRGVTLLRADWTNRNDAIAHELARFGRTGVPLYVLYDSRGRPHLLPEILTEGAVLDALSDL